MQSGKRNVKTIHHKLIYYIIGRRLIQPLHIITGKGSHSEYGEAKLFPSATKYLKTHGWLYDIPHAGSILVKGVKN
jgi:hypothetical protein